MPTLPLEQTQSGSSYNSQNGITGGILSEDHGEQCLVLGTEQQLAQLLNKIIAKLENLDEENVRFSTLATIVL